MRVAVVGAGLAGLAAAGALSGDHQVVVYDRARSVGGRMATRRIGDATFDHGAQFFTVRDARFAAVVERLIADEVVAVWCRGFGSDDGYPRYIGCGGMNAVAKSIAVGLDCRLGSLVFTLRRDRAEWIVVLDTGHRERFDAVVLAVPTPQASALLAESGVDLPTQLRDIRYARTLTLLATLDRSPELPAPGAVQLPQAGPQPLAFVADNHAKRVSGVPCVTVHASDAWSEQHWAARTESVAGELGTAAGEWLGPARIVGWQLKRWRLATPVDPWPEPTWVDDAAQVAVAGDAFAGPRLEAAYLSGLAAAAALTR